MTEAEQNKLIIEHMDDLVPAIAADYRGGDLEFDELLAAGREGLTKAARSYNPDLSKFTTWATTRIKSEISHAIAAAQAQWTGESVSIPFGGDSIEKVYEWDSWGNRGNASAICEQWSGLDASPEDLSMMFDALKDQRTRFAAAFISLTGSQRKLVGWVFLGDPNRNITQAARELGVSYSRAVRMLKKALLTMREVIIRMDRNETYSGSTDGRQLITGRRGIVAGIVAA